MRAFLTKYLAVVVLPVITCCEKMEVDQNFTTFGEVYFDANNTAISTTGHLKVKYNAQPIDMGVDGRIRVPEGEGNFEFYDERTGEVLGEKTVNIVSGSAEKFNLFQPSDKDPIAFLDPNGQANEEAAPDGFMKIRIANYATKLLPDTVDIVFHGLVGRAYVATDTVAKIGTNLGDEAYYLVKRGGVSETRPNYQLSFINHQTQEAIKNIGGTVFFSTAIFADGVKHVYTIYLTSSQLDYEAPGFLESGDKYYTIAPNILYKD